MSGPTRLRMSVRKPVSVIASASATLIGAKLGGGRWGVWCACSSPPSSCVVTAVSLTGASSFGYREEDRRPREGRPHEDEQHDEHQHAHAHVPASELSVHRGPSSKARPAVDGHP